MFKIRAKELRVRRGGQALIEMAFVVTILLFLTLGILQFALLANARTTLTNLSREGARFAAIHATESGSDNSTDPTKGIKAYVALAADATPLNSITAANVTVSPPEGNASRISSYPITVTVTYNMRSKFILPTTFPGLAAWGTNTSSSTTMIIE